MAETRSAVGTMIDRLGRLFAFARTKPQRPETSRVYMTPRTTAGVYIDPDRALQNAVVWACVRYLTSAIGQLPWRVMRETDEGADKFPSHPVDYILSTRPNPEMGAFTFRECLLGDALLWGNGYAEIERDQAGRLAGLWYIHPSRVNPRRDETNRLVFEVSNYTGATTVLQPDDVFHLRGYGAGPVGFNVVQYAAQSIGWAEATKLFGAGFFGQGMNPSGIVEIPGSLTREAMGVMMESFRDLYGGPKGQRTAFLDKGMKWQKITQTPDEAQFIETAQHQVEEICRWFGVPPHKVMHMLRSTFSNIEHQSIEVVVDTLAPWVRRFEEEADYKLFGANRQGFFTKMNLNGLLRGDSLSRATIYKALYEMGALSANDVLAFEDMNPIGADGDQRFISANLQPLNADDRIAEKKPPAPPPGQQKAATGDAPMNFTAAREAARKGLNGSASHH